MTARGRIVHYVRYNETTRQPRRHVLIDTEAHRLPHRRGEQQTWRCGVAVFRAQEGRREPERRSGRYETPEELWEAVSAFTRPRKRTVVWAHNLAYDLRIAAAFDLLPQLGWTLQDLNVGRQSTWCRWRRGDASLVMVDSASVFNCSLEELGRDFNVPKMPLPYEDSSAEEWFTRCERDVEILELAVMNYLAWIEADDFGVWQMTGAGQSWAAWRHRFLEHKVLVHDDPAALAAERRAMWTGRCEAWWHGADKSGRIWEYDLELAYCRLASEIDVPTRFMAFMPKVSIRRWQQLTKEYAVVADVTITTSVPVVPTHHEKRILWPVGTFKTTLWDVELQAALDAGAEVTLHRCWVYRKEPALRAWATWILDTLLDKENPPPNWQKRVLKHWSRALIGRFAMRYSKWEPFATAPDNDVCILPGVNADTGDEYTLMRAGRQVLSRSAQREGDNSVPAITGYVMAACRVRLWKIMQAVGESGLLYVDTDSVMVTGPGRRAIDNLPSEVAGWGLRLKRSWRGFEIRGPRNITTGDLDRISGVPRRATRQKENEWHGEVWQSLDESLRTGTAASVLVAGRTWRLRGTDRRRVAPRGRAGRTRPFTVGLDDDAD